jgi:sugar/nucleoside kinase (ribokinase family)
MIRWVSFGVVIDDLVTWRGAAQMGVLGGGGPQTAWGMAAALGGGEAVGLVAGIGADADQALFAPLRAAGIDLRGLRRTDAPTPRAWQLVEADGARTQVWCVPTPTLSGQLARSWEVLPTPYRDAVGFHWGIHPEQPDLDLAHALTTQGRVVSLETFRAPAQPIAPLALAALMRACAVFSAAESEILAMSGCDRLDHAVRRFAAAGCRLLSVRQGAAGSAIYDFARGERLHLPALPVAVVDVTGAGNAYCGALLATLDQGAQTAACHAAAAASYMVEQVGLPAHLPPRDDYEARFQAVWREVEVTSL